MAKVQQDFVCPVANLYHNFSLLFLIALRSSLFAQPEQVGDDWGLFRKEIYQFWRLSTGPTQQTCSRHNKCLPPCGFFTKQSHRKITLWSSVFYIVEDRFSALFILKGFNFLWFAFHELTIGQVQDFMSCPRKREIRTEKEKICVLVFWFLLCFTWNSH